jgi:predicted Ser/Thr protein kinase
VGVQHPCWREEQPTVSAKDFLKETGAVVSRDFLQDRSILSFEEYLELFLQGPHSQVRNSAQYLRDVLDHFGTSHVEHHPAGPMRRFKLFDLTDGERMGRVAGQEEVQNTLYRMLGNFVRAGAVNKLLMLHGPNGSAKSTVVDALKRGMELYSREPQGALYEIAWIFPSEKLVKGNIGFGDRPGGSELTTFAHLDEESVEVRVQCEMRDHPLFAMPRSERWKLLERGAKTLPRPADGEAVLADWIVEGELCHKCRRIYSALLAASNGDWLRVLRHVQVRRFYLSRRYLVGAVTVEPHLSVDAAYHQVSADRSQANLPAALQNVVLFEPHGPLVNANRGIMEYADLLKRPLEAF